MTAKQIKGNSSPDGSEYGTLVDGVGTLSVTSVSSLGTLKQIKGSESPDGSSYFTLTDGSGNLI